MIHLYLEKCVGTFGKCLTVTFSDFTKQNERGSLHLQTVAHLHGGDFFAEVARGHMPVCCGTWTSVPALTIALDKSGHFFFLISLEILKIFLQIIVAVHRSNFMHCLHSETRLCIGSFQHLVFLFSAFVVLGGVFWYFFFPHWIVAGGDVTKY